MTTRDDRASTGAERCECGHAKARHELPGFDGECVADGCRCRVHTPRIITMVAPVLPARPPVHVARSGIEQLLTQGKRSQSKRTRALVDRLEADVTNLYSRLRAERAMIAAQAAAASAKAVVEEPLAVVEPLPAEDLDVTPELAAGRARKSPPADKTCDLCDPPKDGIRNLGAHQYHSHGIRKAG